MTFAGSIEAQFTLPAGTSFTATNSGGGPTTLTPTPGVYTLSTFIPVLQTLLNTRTPANWTVTYDKAAATLTGKVTINWTGTGTYSIAWTGSGTNLRDLLGFTADLSSITQGVASTGTKQARGLWQPDHPLFSDMDIKRAPMVTDASLTMSPTGKVFGLVGNVFYKHTGFRWSNVSLNRVWEGDATVSNQSFEQFWKDSQVGQGHAWFSIASPMIITDHRGSIAGSDQSISAWQATTLISMEAAVKRASGSWNGQWSVSLANLVSAG